MKVALEYIVITGPLMSFLRQLTLMCDQCDCRFVSEHIAPVAIKMACDRVAQVRNTALSLVSTVRAVCILMQFISIVHALLIKHRTVCSTVLVV